MPELEQILVWLIVGVLSGAAASGVVRRSLSFAEMTIAGLIGAFLGGFLVNMFDIDLPDASLTFTLGDLITAFVGALVLIAIAELVLGARYGRGRSRR